MGLETGDYISDLNAANPLGTDAKSQGDDHLRLVKKVVKQSFPNVNAAVTGTPAQLNNAASANPTYTTIELGHASDTTLARIAAGRVSIEGGEVAKLNAQQPFSVEQKFGSEISMENALPLIRWNETDAAANNRRWRMYVQGEAFVFDIASDTEASNATIMGVQRTNSVVDAINFYGPVVINSNGLTVTTTAGGAVFNDIYAVRSTTSPTGNVGTNPWLQLYNTTDIDGVGFQLAPGGGFDVWADPGTGWTRLGRWSTNGLALGASFDAAITRIAANRIAIAGIEIGYRQVPRATSYTLDLVGKCFATTNNFTVDGVSGWAAGDCFTAYNDSAAAITITQGASMTLRLGGSTSTGNRTLAPRGIATLWFNSTTECIVTGSGLT